MKKPRRNIRLFDFLFFWTRFAATLGIALLGSFLWGFSVTDWSTDWEPSAHGQAAAPFDVNQLNKILGGKQNDLQKCFPAADDASKAVEKLSRGLFGKDKKAFKELTTKTLAGGACGAEPTLDFPTSCQALGLGSDKKKSVITSAGDIKKKDQDAKVYVECQKRNIEKVRTQTACFRAQFDQLNQSVKTQYGIYKQYHADQKTQLDLVKQRMDVKIEHLGTISKVLGLDKDGKPQEDAGLNGALKAAREAQKNLPALHNSIQNALKEIETGKNKQKTFERTARSEFANRCMAEDKVHNCTPGNQGKTAVKTNEAMSFNDYLSCMYENSKKVQKNSKGNYQVDRTDSTDRAAQQQAANLSAALKRISGQFAKRQVAPAANSGQTTPAQRSQLASIVTEQDALAAIDRELTSFGALETLTLKPGEPAKTFRASIADMAKQKVKYCFGQANAEITRDPEYQQQLSEFKTVQQQAQAKIDENIKIQYADYNQAFSRITDSMQGLPITLKQGNLMSEEQCRRTPQSCFENMRMAFNAFINGPAVMEVPLKGNVKIGIPDDKVTCNGLNDCISRMRNGGEQIQKQLTQLNSDKQKQITAMNKTTDELKDILGKQNKSLEETRTRIQNLMTELGVDEEIELSLELNAEITEEKNPPFEGLKSFSKDPVFGKVGKDPATAIQKPLTRAQEKLDRFQEKWLKAQKEYELLKSSCLENAGKGNLTSFSSYAQSFDDQLCQFASGACIKGEESLETLTSDMQAIIGKLNTNGVELDASTVSALNGDRGLCGEDRKKELKKEIEQTKTRCTGWETVCSKKVSEPVKEDNEEAKLSAEKTKKTCKAIKDSCSAIPTNPEGDIISFCNEVNTLTTSVQILAETAQAIAVLPNSNNLCGKATNTKWQKNCQQLRDKIFTTKERLEKLGNSGTSRSNRGK